MAADRPKDRAWIKLKQTYGEIVRMLGFGLVRSEAPLRKVLQILRDDPLFPSSFGTDRG